MAKNILLSYIRVKYKIGLINFIKIRPPIPEISFFCVRSWDGFSFLNSTRNHHNTSCCLFTATHTTQHIYFIRLVHSIYIFIYAFTFPTEIILIFAQRFAYKCLPGKSRNTIRIFTIINTLVMRSSHIYALV